MIPKIEEMLISSLEKRVTETVSGVAPSFSAAPETIVTTIESRKFEMNLQDQGNGLVYGLVEAEISVCFFSDRVRYDYSAMMASFAENPFLEIEGASPAQIMRMESESIIDGAYLCQDAWGFMVRYYITGDGFEKEWQVPKINSETAQKYDVYPRDMPYMPHEPKTVLDILGV